jgi:hypothetical protein
MNHVDGDAVELEDGPTWIGPQDGKRPGQNGPVNEALSRPWLYVYDAEGSRHFREAVAWPDGDRLHAAYTATEGQETLVYDLVPFTSSYALPDYFVYTPQGGVAAGFFGADWKVNSFFGQP